LVFGDEGVRVRDCDQLGVRDARGQAVEEVRGEDLLVGCSDQEDSRAGVKVRKIFVRYVRDAVNAGVIAGDPTDLALVFFTVVEGLANAENARRLGGSKQSVNRRWQLGVDSLIRGFS
jgi:hypothetical protein